jgi:hypothetical protein
MKAMAERRAKLKLTRNDVVIGCPLCLIEFPAPAANNTADAR